MFGIVEFRYFFSTKPIPIQISLTGPTSIASLVSAIPISILVSLAGAERYRYLVAETKISVNNTDTDTDSIAHPCRRNKQSVGVVVENYIFIQINDWTGATNKHSVPSKLINYLFGAMLNGFLETKKRVSQ